MYKESHEMSHNSLLRVVVFDRAPTSHTLDLLSFFWVIEKGVDKILGFRNQVASILAQIKKLL
jgi:anion-transporting  ArsA/GET3 family ATPase